MLARWLRGYLEFLNPYNEKMIKFHVWKMLNDKAPINIQLEKNKNLYTWDPNINPSLQSQNSYSAAYDDSFGIKDDRISIMETITKEL